MPRNDIFDTIAALRAHGRPFALATVMRTADITSAKAGAKAAITEDGRILGHLGGACVQRAVLRAASDAMETGATRTIRVKPADNIVALTDPDGAEVFRSGCPSGGTVDLLIEGYRLPMMVAVLGASPVAEALVAQARLMGWRAAQLERGATEGFGLGALDLGESDAVIVSTQGRADLDALREALSSPATFVGMVASRRKAAHLCAKLRDEGLTQELLDRLHSPVGLDLGGFDPAEIALSVAAEIVAHRSALTAARSIQQTQVLE